MKVRFGIIGNNWGDRIYKILKSTNNDVIKLFNLTPIGTIVDINEE